MASLLATYDTKQFSLAFDWCRGRGKNHIDNSCSVHICRMYATKREQTNLRLSHLLIRKFQNNNFAWKWNNIKMLNECHLGTTQPHTQTKKILLKQIWQTRTSTREQGKNENTAHRILEARSIDSVPLLRYSQFMAFNSAYSHFMNMFSPIILYSTSL